MHQSKTEISIFSNISDYAKKDQEETVQVFTPLLGKELSFVNSNFLLDATEAPSVDVLNLLFIVYLVTSMVVYEKNKVYSSCFLR